MRITPKIPFRDSSNIKTRKLYNEQKKLKRVYTLIKLDHVDQ